MLSMIFTQALIVCCGGSMIVASAVSGPVQLRLLFKFVKWRNILRQHFHQMSYKQTIKTEIKRAVRRFNRLKFHPSRTHTIEKRLHKKKYMRHSFNYYQRLIKHCSPDACHVLNFYNILAINETAIRNPAHDQSFIKTHFYYKNMKSIEASQHHFIVHLEDNPSLVCPVTEFIARYKQDPDVRFRKMGQLLEDIERRLEVHRPASEEASTLEADAERVLRELEGSAFIIKIGSDRLGISRRMMELFGYDTQEFIIECMKFRVPLFEGFACESYYEIVMKNLENVLLIMDLLAGRIPLESFRELAYFQFNQRVYSRHNCEYKCKMSLSMPVPLIAVIKVEDVLETREHLEYDGAMGSYKDFKNYIRGIREKEFTTLQHLITLPPNSLPSNTPKVAKYLNLSDDQNQKSVLTVPIDSQE